LLYRSDSDTTLLVTVLIEFEECRDCCRCMGTAE